ncbi:hypothetical protein JN086_15800 [Mycolicibacterium austroafricanum]|uniref:Uncharacterized protein n=1 Tax=Mycolicibacterium austroafricanum TaxID=39687 RepID=A0ABT8HEP9_MYCAO|nr:MULTISPECIES: hypothetical protein [Mycolicibacterium]MDN4518747.1 hypothetical protein [Mycolicibacterium austroafricanum]QRZ09656.1 hypothetical protein JN090_14840 [Mycolicibacterium austroafricanum]QZT66068.1 hypothetical protein JN086_15800 [Mycolicibacterium austroafricanum]UJL27584.1 hypothetical protein HZU38_22165 [Mycolicibacterium vanbaalenii]WND54266.1 hypothetical protein QQA43_15780 [Mycolicibacterium vanbaalenii]
MTRTVRWASIPPLARVLVADTPTADRSSGAGRRSAGTPGTRIRAHRGIGRTGGPLRFPLPAIGMLAAESLNMLPVNGFTP